MQFRDCELLTNSSSQQHCCISTSTLAKHPQDNSGKVSVEQTVPMPSFTHAAIKLLPFSNQAHTEEVSVQQTRHHTASSNVLRTSQCIPHRHC
eukprot:1375523-Amphidinium_carterae.3